MKIIICLDKNGGMSFNRRRQSRDRIVIKDILQSVAGKTLYVHPDSASLFPKSPNIILSETFMNDAADEYYCFVENIALGVWEKHISEITVYNWNRVYPADMRFDICLEDDQWKLAAHAEFDGSSHKMITKNVYRK